jgi:DNA-nicking Smr family endonuclease
MKSGDTNPHQYPIDGTLDLHHFAPADTKEVVTEYLAECLRRDILTVRIVHGKGIGVKRQIVQSLLEKHPEVDSFRSESGSGGGWGATVVNLKPLGGGA